MVLIGEEPIVKLGFRSTFKSMFNVKSWIGWESVSQSGSWIQSLFTAMLKRPNRPMVQETYQEACEKYGYTKEFLEKQEKGFLQASQIYLGVLCVGLGYMAWLMAKHHTVAALIMVPINFMLFALFFRESFWHMQLKHKKLGMTFQNWVSIVVLKNG